MKYLLAFVLGMVLTYYQTKQWHERVVDRLLSELLIPNDFTLDDFISNEDCRPPERWGLSLETEKEFEI